MGIAALFSTHLVIKIHFPIALVPLFFSILSYIINSASKRKRSAPIRFFCLRSSVSSGTRPDHAIVIGRRTPFTAVHDDRGTRVLKLKASRTREEGRSLDAKVVQINPRLCSSLDQFHDCASSTHIMVAVKTRTFPPRRATDATSTAAATTRMTT